jgi:hypothetical protein
MSSQDIFNRFQFNLENAQLLFALVQCNIEITYKPKLCQFELHGFYESQI